MEQNEIKFTLVDTKKVCVSGFPELVGREGCFFWVGLGSRFARTKTFPAPNISRTIRTTRGKR